MTSKVLVLPGDGIGPEIIGAAIKILAALRAAGELDIEWQEALIGGAAVDAHGVPLPWPTEPRGAAPTTVEAEVALVSCRDACIPDQFTLRGDIAVLRAADPDALRSAFARASSSLPLAPKVAGVRVEPWMSRDGIRPSERVELGWAIYPMDPAEVLDGELDAVAFFPEKVSGLKLEEIRVTPHPASAGALWVSAKTLASAKPLTEMQLLRGVFQLDEKRSIAVELPMLP